jgi:hypothetical protein
MSSAAPTPPASPTPPARRRPRGRGRLLPALLLFVALIEVVARLATGTAHNGMPAVLRYPLLPYRPTEALIREHIARNSGSTYVVPDRELGWSVGASGQVTLGDGSLLYQSNAQALRADPGRVYAEAPTPGTVRILTVGDSFTHCDDVPNADTWQVALEAGQPGLEVLNLGVPGYGTDQAFLRWRRDGRRWQGQLVILGIWPENLCRNLSLVRYYLVPTEGFSQKPRFVLEGGALAVVNSPVMDQDELVATLTAPESRPLLAHERWYSARETSPTLLQTLRSVRIAQSILSLYERKQLRARLYSGEDPAAIEITVAIAAQFAREVREAGSTPLIALIPMRDLLAQHTSPQTFPLVAALRAAGLEVLDLGPTFGRRALELGESRVYIAQGHHTPEGNRLLAAALAEQLQPHIDAARR